MDCPPGTFLNPRTLRCIKPTGRKAHELVRQGAIPDYYARQRAKTARKPSLAAAFGAAPTYRQHAFRNTYKKPVVKLLAACPQLDQERNPITNRCIKIGGLTHKQLYAPPPPLLPAPAPAPLPPPPQELRRISSEGPIKLPIGSAGIAPLADRSMILGWAHSQCKNNRDAISGVPFVSADATALQDLIRLHDRTCVMSGALNAKVTAEHKAGQVATIPGDPSSHLTIDDFKALRDSMRRHDPAYKIPGRKHQPPPANWQLYISPDNRSGPGFASVLFLDEKKITKGPGGPVIPLDAVVIDMGFIPLTITDSLCKPQLVIDLIQRLAAANRLLVPVAGGWKPVGGFPFKDKKYWSTDGRNRFSKLCQTLTKLLTTPM